MASERAGAKFIQINEKPPLTPYPAAPGDWRFVGQDYKPCEPPKPGAVAYLQFACLKPGGGFCGQLLVGNGFKPAVGTWEARATWNWNGDCEKPNLEPSINCLAHNPQKPTEKYAGCGWHAWLTAGVFGDRK